MSPHTGLGYGKALWLLCLALLLLTLPADLFAAKKGKPQVSRLPNLRIVNVSVEPLPFDPAKSALTFTVDFDLPTALDRTSILELTTLISSPSKRSLSFLSERKFLDEVSPGTFTGRARETANLDPSLATPTDDPQVEQPASGDVTTTSGRNTDTPHTMGTGSAKRTQFTLHLTWDGKDQADQLMPSGTYNYEVRAKLLVPADNAPRTFMTAWPKRGTLTIIRSGQSAESQEKQDRPLPR
jgi:hypothetical protein